MTLRPPSTHIQRRRFSVGPVRLSICEFTTLGASFEEDLAAYRAAGVEGIGVCEIKLGEGAAERLRESGLRATHCVPAVPSILPLPLMEGPEEPEERVDALCASVRRFAELDPVCVQFLTGPAGGRTDAREIVREGIRAVAAAGEAAGVRVALEPMHPTQSEVFSLAHTIPYALELIGEETVAIMLDTWHVSDPDAIEPYIDEIVGVHVSDRREPTRSHFDRVLPGDGVLDLAAVFRTLEAGGYDGWYDVEIFSDNGAFGEAFHDSLWDVDPHELARRARESVERVWEQR
jgi:sugar phosphate isomerase/epimerase